MGRTYGYDAATDEEIEEEIKKQASGMFQFPCSWRDDADGKIIETLSADDLIRAIKHADCFHAGQVPGGGEDGGSYDSDTVSAYSATVSINEWIHHHDLVDAGDSNGMIRTARPYESLIVDVPDHPKPGIVFRDIMPVLADAGTLKAVIEDISSVFEGTGIDKVVGAESRGFMIAPAIAVALSAGFVPARKPGKLPREVIEEEYALEYGTDVLQIQSDAIRPGEKVLVVDDLLATGGTALAMARLVGRLGGEVAGFAFFVSLDGLGGKKTIDENYPGVKMISLVDVE